MRKLKFFALILSLMTFLGAFAACNPENSSSESSTPTHTCESVCEECGKCTDEACTEEACEDKCPGHTVDLEPEPEVPSNDTQATFSTFEKTGEYEYSLKVSNATETLALEALVSVNVRSSWTLSSDESGNQAIESKAATLTVGDNTYYVLVKAEDNSTQVYTLKIRRKAMYDVVFDVAGGESVANQQVEEGGFAIAPETTKVGYDFVAWNFDFTTPITENKTIVASWEAKEYTITYNAAGGNVANATQKVAYDSNYTLEEPTRMGYEFLGWYLDEDKVESGKWERVTDITLTAKWGICEYTVQYDLKNGSVAAANPTSYTIEDEDLLIADPTREHYNFLGWTGTGLSEPTKSLKIVSGSVGDREYVANWEAKEYTVTYYLDGGKNSDNNPDKYTIETADITLQAPTRTSYTFDGWYQSETFEATSKITKIVKGSTGDLELYAKWTAITSGDGEEGEEEVDNLPNVTITQTRSQYVTSNDYSSVSTYAAFTAAATPTYLVPGLKEGLIPQSMDVWEAKDLLLISGYFASASLNKSGSPSSMIVAIDLKTGNFAGKYCLKNVDGSHHTGHVGGLAVTEKNIFISSGRTLYRIPLSQMERLGKSGTLQVVETIKVAALGSFCNYSDGVLWVGDFINTTEVPVLPDSVCSYKAWAVGYKVKDTESEFSSENWDPATMEYATPDYALSITNKVQGLAFVNGKVALSTSYGRSKNSKIYVYNSPLQSAQDASITVNGKSVPVWILDGTFLKTSYTLMPMSEGLSSYKGKLLVVFESGTLKYNNATNPTDHVWSVTLPE